MDPGSIVSGVMANAIWWILLVVVITPVVYYLGRYGRGFFRNLALARKIQDHGINRFVFSRHEYPERLDAYLNRARRSIKIVSISFKLTSDECQLGELFRRKIAAGPTFEVCISLLRPGSDAARLAAASLDVKPEALDKEIGDMLGELKTLRAGLPPADYGRLLILTHDSMPMGSAIMLDADHPDGTIQVETKLYKAPRSESFSYQARAGSPFFERNLKSWNRVITESQPV